MRTAKCVALLALAQFGAAFVPQSALPRRSSLTVRPAAADEVAQVQADLAGKVGQQLGLKLTDYTQTLGMESWAQGAASGTAKWMDEASPQLLNGVSVAATSNGMATRFQLNGWVSPSFEVPHMLTSMTVTPAGVEVRMDYIGRDDLAYCSGGYMQTFYGGDVMQAWNGAMSSGPALPPLAQWQGRLLQSPAAVAVLVPDVGTAAQMVDAHVGRWLSWLASAQPIVARKRGAMNARDDSLRRMAYEFEVGSCVAFLGDEPTGVQLGAAVTGPISEAYVGGGS